MTLWGLRSQRLDGRLLADELLERAPGQVLHRDVVGAVPLPAVVDADHVLMREPGRARGLAAEALDELVVLREAAVQELERHLAPELLVLGAEDVGHPAGAEPAEDLVAAVDHGVGHELSHFRAGSP
jgi:hypothetical protein